MYGFDEMIDMSLKDGEQWPSVDHRHVARTLAIRNSLVKNLDTMIAIKEAVCKVPIDRIREVTFPELVDEFACPRVW